MSGTGLKELFELVYAPNAVTHMLSEKAVSRSVRGFVLVDIALHCLMTEEMFGRNRTNDEVERAEPSLSNNILTEAGQLFEKLLNRKETVENVVNHDALKAVEKEFELQKMRFKELRTSNLWLSFCEMVAVLLRFLLAE